MPYEISNLFLQKQQQNACSHRPRHMSMIVKNTAITAYCWHRCRRGRGGLYNTPLHTSPPFCSLRRRRDADCPCCFLTTTHTLGNSIHSRPQVFESQPCKPQVFQSRPCRPWVFQPQPCRS